MTDIIVNDRLWSFPDAWVRLAAREQRLLDKIECLSALNNQMVAVLRNIRATGQCCEASSVGKDCDENCAVNAVLSHIDSSLP